MQRIGSAGKYLILFYFIGKNECFILIFCFFFCQIKQLRKEKIIVEAKFATFKLSTGVDELKDKVKALQQDVSNFKAKYNSLKYDHDDVNDKYEKLKVRSAIAQQKPPTVDEFSQTDPPKCGATFVEQMDLQRAVQRAEKYKKAYEQTVTAYNELKPKYKQLEAKYKELSDSSTIMEKKYTETKRICNNRFTMIQDLEKAKLDLQRSEAALTAELTILKEKFANLNEKFAETSKELDRFMRKYEMAKKICEIRKLDIDRLNKTVQEQSANNENVPRNAN